MLVTSISLIEANVDNLTRGIKTFPVTPNKQMQCEKRMCSTLQIILCIKLQMLNAQVKCPGLNIFVLNW